MPVLVQDNLWMNLIQRKFPEEAKKIPSCKSIYRQIIARKYILHRFNLELIWDISFDYTLLYKNILDTSKELKHLFVNKLTDVYNNIHSPDDIDITIGIYFSDTYIDNGVFGNEKVINIFSKYVNGELLFNFMYNINDKQSISSSVDNDYIKRFDDYSIKKYHERSKRYQYYYENLTLEELLKRLDQFDILMGTIETLYIRECFMNMYEKMSKLLPIKLIA